MVDRLPASGQFAGRLQSRSRSGTATANYFRSPPRGDPEANNQTIISPGVKLVIGNEVKQQLAAEQAQTAIPRFDPMALK